MPYQNEHSCRIESPEKFQSDSFRRMTRKHEGKEYSIILGRLKGEETMTEQAYRYNVDDWSESDAKKHCETYDGDFHPASEEEESEQESDGVWIAVAKTGQTKRLTNGDEVTISESVLKSNLESWKNGDIEINHKASINGPKILDAKYESPFLYMKFDEKTADLFRKSDASGWSIKFNPESIEMKGNEIVKADGLNISILYPPHTPTCSPEMGCQETMEKKNDDMIDDLKSAFERVVCVLKSAFVRSEIKKGEFSQEQLDKKNEMEGKDDLDLKLKESEAAFETQKTEIEKLKTQIAAFEQEKRDVAMAKLNSEWEQLKKTVIPPGLVAKEDAEKELRSEFETRPHDFIMKMAGFERKEATKEEGSEFEIMEDEFAKAAKELEEASGVEI